MGQPPGSIEGRRPDGRTTTRGRYWVVRHDDPPTVAVAWAKVVRRFAKARAGAGVGSGLIVHHDDPPNVRASMVMALTARAVLLSRLPDAPPWIARTMVSGRCGQDERPDSQKRINGTVDGSAFRALAMAILLTIAAGRADGERTG
jgi:hypothetical protein